jgi:hypothetical protein
MLVAGSCGGYNPGVIVVERTVGRPGLGLGVGVPDLAPVVRPLPVKRITAIDWARLPRGVWSNVASVPVATVNGEDDAK